MFKDNVKKLRLDKKLSQEDLAKALYVSQQAVSLWETGKGYPDIPTLRSLATFFNVKVDDLIGVEEFAKAKSEKKMKPTLTFVLALVTLSLLIIILIVTLVVSTTSVLSINWNLISGIVLLSLVVALDPLLYFFYKSQSSKLMLAGLLSFGLLFATFIGLTIASFITMGGNKATPYAWLVCSLVTGFAFSSFLYLLKRNKSVLEAKPSEAKVVNNSSSNKSGRGWPISGLVVGLLNYVLYFVPMLVARSVIPGSDGSYKETIYHFSIYQNLVNSQVFIAAIVVSLIFFGALVVLSLIDLLGHFKDTTKKKLTNWVVVVLGLSVVVFLISLFFAFVCMPTY